MTNRSFKLLLLSSLMVQGAILIAPANTFRSVKAQSADAPPEDNQELARLMREDQADRTPPPGESINWKIVVPRDRARLVRVKEIYQQNQLQTGTDNFEAALILQHSDLPEDYLLAHELCIVAISKGKHVESLAAASEDRFLMSLGRPQRFGTQFLSRGNGVYRLYKMDAGVTDQLHRMMHVPTAAEALRKEAEMNKRN